MEKSGTAAAIREEKGCLRYEYFITMKDSETVLLIDSWESQEAIDLHHNSEMMRIVTELREKYDLHMRAERFTSPDKFPEKDKGFLRE